MLCSVTSSMLLVYWYWFAYFKYRVWVPRRQPHRRQA